jgi:hypothetical protein
MFSCGMLLLLQFEKDLKTLTWNIICEYTFFIKLIISTFSNGIGGGGGGGF